VFKNKVIKKHILDQFVVVLVQYPIYVLNQRIRCFYMTTIGDLVRDNPFYEQGLIFDKSYYTKRISPDSFNTPVSKNRCDQAILLQALLEGVKKITLLSLVIIPSVYALGAGVGLSVILSGVVASTTSADPKIGDMHLVKQITLQGRLLAIFVGDQQVAYLAKILSIDLVSKVGFAVLLRRIPLKVASQLGTLGLFFVSYSLGQDIQKLLCWGLETYSNHQNKEKLKVLDRAFS
jgi:hypothetical protein